MTLSERYEAAWRSLRLSFSEGRDAMRAAADAPGDAQPMFRRLGLELDRDDLRKALRNQRAIYRSLFAGALVVLGLSFGQPTTSALYVMAQGWLFGVAAASSHARQVSKRLANLEAEMYEIDLAEELGVVSDHVRAIDESDWRPAMITKQSFDAMRDSMFQYGPTP